MDYSVVEALWKEMQRLKVLPLCVHIVIKTLNLEVSCCRLAHYIKQSYLTVCHMCSTIIFPHSANQIIVLWHRCCGCCRPCLNSLLRQMRNDWEYFFNSSQAQAFFSHFFLFLFLSLCSCTLSYKSSLGTSVVQQPISGFAMSWLVLIFFSF